MHGAAPRHADARVARIVAFFEALQPADTRRIAEYWQTYDLWLTPTVTSPPPKLGTYVSPPDDPQERAAKDLRGAGQQKPQGGPREELVK